MNVDLSIEKQKYSEMDITCLVVKCQSGDMLAMETLVKRQQKIVYSTLYHLLSDKNNISDLAQEVLYRMCKSIKNLRNPSTFKWWLNQIINNLVYDELRRKKRKMYTVSIDAPLNEEEEIATSRDISDSTQQPDEKSLNVELDEKIRRAIQKLPEQFKVVIVYRELQGLSYDEIAKLTGANLGTVKSRIARARTRLQEELKPYLDV